MNLGIKYAIIYGCGWLRCFYGLKPAYSRKMCHLTFYGLEFIVDALLGELNDNIMFALIWAVVSRSIFFLFVLIPTRNAANKCLGDVRDEDNAKWKRYDHVVSRF